jgi:peptidoglycan/xylan/chitin deacetylase (PgdA/CDA1 family)
MRTPQVLLAGLVLGVLAGCGPAGTSAEPTAATPVAAPPRAAEAPAAKAPATKKPRPPAVPAKRKPVPGKSKPGRSEPGRSEPDKSARGKPARSKPVAGKPAHGKRHAAGGPAASLMRTGRAGVALTFDDGPDPVQTPKLLDLLKREHVKATFCLVGENVAAYPGLVRRIAAEGHTLCNHTWRHSLTLGRKKPDVIRADLQRTDRAIRRAVPKARVKYMRAPGGNFTPAFVAVAAELGMKSIYWQVDPKDWDHPKGESPAAHQAKIVHTVKKHVGKGAIVLSHDYGQPATITAYRKLLPWLRQRYQLIALP